MNVSLAKFCIIVLLFMFCRLNAEVTVENGAYKDILVRFSPRIKSEDGKLLLDEMKNVLTATSEVLHTAIGLKISSVVFLLPKNWQLSQIESLETVGKATTEHTHLPPDILVDDISDSAFGNYPFTLQYGGCMIPGRQISIQESFLTAEEELPKGKLLAREWLKHRYGVFDENGFPGDTMYPLYYQIPGSSSSDIHITDCTDPAAKYYFRKGDENCTLTVSAQTGLPDIHPSECRIYVEEESINQVKSSMMYFHMNLTHVESICGDEEHQHNSASPNKQNTLCSGKSIGEVIRLSPDIKSTGENTEEITFSYVQENAPKVVITWQNTANLNGKKDVIMDSIIRLLHDLPNESKVGLYRFTDEITPLRELTDTQAWPTTIISTFTSQKQPCVTCAIENAVNVLSADKDDKRGFIVIIAAANPSEYEEVIQQINSSQLCLVIIGFTDRGATSDGFEDMISASHCGTFWEVSTEEENPKAFEKLYNAMETILPPPDTNYITTLIATEYLEHGKSLKIPKDDRASKFTLRLTRGIEDELISCKVNEIPLNLTIEGFSSFSFPSQADAVECSLTTDIISGILTQIQMTTKPNQYFDNHVWVRDTTNPEGNIQMPVIIYAEINYGGQPVQNADVNAEVTGPNGKKRLLQLYDDGLGDPDITANDGIYSRYFIDFDEKDEYKVIVTATDNNLQAKLGRNGAQPCCGSKVVSDTDPLSAFKESITSTFKVISGKPFDGYKPSRILDLRITKYDVPNSVSLQWTAPGGEADSGTASSYELKLYCKQEDCTTNGSLPNWVTVNSISKPESYGVAQEAVIDFHSITPKNQTVHIGIKSINQNGHISDLSNLVAVNLAYSSPDEMTTIETPWEEDKSTQSSKIGVIVGSTVTVVFLFMCFAVVIYLYVYKPKCHKQPDADKRNGEIGDNADSTRNSKSLVQPNSYGSSMRRVESFPVLLYTHDQIRHDKGKKKEPPLYPSNIAPKPWMSLDTLPSSKVNKFQADPETRSVGSQSTLNVKDENISDLQKNEIQQLHDTSQESVLDTGNISKF